MKKTISLVLVLALGLTAKIANADFTFGTPTNLPNVNISAQEFAPEISADEFDLYLMSDRPGGYSQEPSEGKIPLTVAAVCMNAKTDTAANIETFTSYISEASEKGAKLIVFPEIALQQNPAWGSSSHQPTEEEMTYIRETAETIPGPSTDALVNIARLYNIFIVFGMTEISSDDILYNASVLLGPDGLLGKYRKRRLADASAMMNEHLIYERGSESGLVESPLGNVGLIICAEMLGQYGRDVAQEGADFLVTVSAWLASFSSYYENRTKQTAIEANRWHIVSNQVGIVGHSRDYGHSRIINPDGEVVADTGDQEGMVIATIGYFNLTKNVDLNGDGFVDASDLCIVIDHWGTDEPSCDLAPPPFGDGIVDVQDLIVLAEHLFTYPGAVAYWKLDETEGDIVYDSVGVNDGILNGEPLWQPTGGMVDGALAFDGIDDYVNTPFVLNPADGKFSVFVWIKGGALGQAILSQAGGANWLCTDSLEGNLMTELKDPGRDAAELLSQTIITDGNWHRIGLVWDGSHRILYVDDVAVAEDTQINLEGSDNGLYIGTGTAMEPGSFFTGLIDDVRIYNRAVTP